MMRRAIPDAEVRRLSALLSRRIGLRPAREADAGLRMAIRARLDALGLADAGEYLSRLEAGAEDELRALLPLVTVGWTEFFRDATQFRALRRRIAPEIIARARREKRRLRIWSAGCATGEEAYSLAMLAADLGAGAGEVELLATDVNPAAIDRARAGHFGARRAAAIDPEQLARHFLVHNGEYRASEALRARVEFKPHNLASWDYPLPRDGAGWDLILCRNVIIYFDGSTTARVIRRFYDCLVDGGLLCLGYSESLFRLGSDFELVEVEGAFVYRRPKKRSSPEARRLEGAVSRIRQLAAGRAPAVPPASPSPSSSSSRVAGANAVPRLERAASRAPAAPAPAASVSPEVVRRAAELLDAGAFEQALGQLQSGIEREPRSLPLLVTLGNTLTVMGRFEEARRAYGAALAAEPLCAEAHLFFAIALYEAGGAARAEAADELRRALFLDPELALAHYYTARLAEQEGDRASARRAYRNAVAACRAPPRTWIAHYPDLPHDPETLAGAAGCALAALEAAG